MVRKTRFPKRGFVYLVSFDPAFGREIKKTRPAVIVSNDHMNEMADTVLVMPITGGLYPYYHWIPLAPPEGGVLKPSSIITEQIRSVDKNRLQKFLGKISPTTMTQIENAIRDHFGLPEGGVLPME
jgi:mRNA interferase MazF